MGKQNNVALSGSQTSWEDKWGINAGALTNASRSNLRVVVKSHANGDYAEVTYTGSGALTLSEFNNLPIGSIIFDFQAFKTHYKTAASAWKSSAAAT